MWNVMCMSCWDLLELDLVLSFVSFGLSVTDVPCPDISFCPSLCRLNSAVPFSLRDLSLLWACVCRLSAGAAVQSPCSEW